MRLENGFTLIEMMLVITIVAVITSLAVMTYHRQAQTTRIDKVALEMQHVLEAALAYNVDHHQWPPAHDQIDCAQQAPSSSSNNPFVAHYVPNQMVKSSFGSYFCWSANVSHDQDDHSQDDHSQDDHSSDGRLFWVALAVPRNDEMLARRIAARLPNAVVTGNLDQEETPCAQGLCYVRAEVVQPAAVSNSIINEGLSVVAIGNCPSTNNNENSNSKSSACSSVQSREGSQYRITFAACGPNQRARVVAFPNFIRFPKDNYPGFTVKDIEAERTADPCIITTSSAVSGSKRESCDIIVHATTCTGKGPNKCSYIDISQAKHSGSIGASYIVSCIGKTIRDISS